MKYMELDGMWLGTEDRNSIQKFGVETWKIIPLNGS
jgi:hypothetical protein